MATTKFRDPVHNFIKFSADEVKLVNLNVLQRLRGIRQLALANLVYPGALHTRFDHTLGVAHVAGEMGEELMLDPDELRLVRLGALLHDIGHGPFSHVSEYALERYADRDKLPAGLKKEKIHEIITAHLIQNDDGIVKALGQDKCEQVAALLGPGVGDPVLKSIVSGPLDADKQDYLLRDSLFAGVNYGIFDLHQLQRSLLSERLGGQKELLIKPDGVHAVEQFVLAKYYLTTMVYRHKVRLVTDQMLVRAIILGIEKDQIPALARLYSFDQTPEFFQNYLRWNDARFFLEFGENGIQDTHSRELIQRLTQRRLLKRVLFARVKEFPPTCKERLMALSKPENHELRTSIETEIAKAIETVYSSHVKSEFTIAHVPNKVCSGKLSE